jgi:hypothetical protein
MALRNTSLAIAAIIATLAGAAAVDSAPAKRFRGAGGGSPEYIVAFEERVASTRRIPDTASLLSTYRLRPGQGSRGMRGMGRRR